MKAVFYLLVVFVYDVRCTSNISSLLDPPMRSSMWRYGFETTKNDHVVNCGGDTLWDEFDGNCGICGDRYDEHPGANNNGGDLAENIIGRYFRQGQVVEIILEIVKPGGYYSFSICKNDDDEPLKQSCFDANPLTRHGDGAIHVMAPEKYIVYAEEFVLPQGLTCENCVLQWNYTQAASCETAEDGTEMCNLPGRIVNCADIRIVPTATALPENVMQPNYTSCDWYIERSLCNRGSSLGMDCGEPFASTPTTPTPQATTPLVNPFSGGSFLPIPIIPPIIPAFLPSVSSTSSGGSASMLPLLALMMGLGGGSRSSSTVSSGSYMVPYTPYGMTSYRVMPMVPYQLYGQQLRWNSMYQYP